MAETKGVSYEGLEQREEQCGHAFCTVLLGEGGGFPGWHFKSPVIVLLCVLVEITVPPGLCTIKDTY